MTIASTTRRAGPYSGNDATTEFSFGFKVFAEGDLQVFVTDTSITTEQTLNVDYSVSLNADQDESPGGTITYPLSGDPLADGLTLDIQGDVAYTQPAALPQGGNFSPRVVENALDRLTMQTIQLADALDLGAIPGGVSLSGLPNAAARAGLLLGFDADGNAEVVAPSSGSAAELAISLAADDDALKGAGQVGFFQAGTGAAGRTLLTKAREVVSVKDFGAVGDFDPSTGLGTDDRAAIQAAFDYAIGVTGGCTVHFPAGRYYGGSAVGAYAGGVAIVLGGVTAASAKNITVEGCAELYQGNVGRFIGIFGADRVTFRGLKIFGYTGGALGSTRENDAALTVNYYSRNVRLEGCYLTNSLGDQVYLGGSLVSGGETGYECRNIEITGCVLKNRYGNGTASVSGGTMSRLALAVIDCVGLNVHDNVIVGAIDLEPNLNAQHIVDCQVHHNRFRSGHVTAQSVIGTAYWHDEPINLTGGSVIVQGVSVTGVSGTPICSGNSVRHNTFEYGVISDYNVYVLDRVEGNIFQQGQIIVGSTSGTNDTGSRAIVGNKAVAPISGETCFIKLAGYLLLSEISGNDAGAAFTYCINNPAGGSTGDGGRIRLLNNSLQNSGTKVSNLTLLSTSVEAGSASMVASYNPVFTDALKVRETWEQHTPVTISGTSLVVNWLTTRGSNWRTSEVAATANSIAQITNAPGDGFELTINCGASGGGTLTLIHNSSYIRLKSSANAVLSGEYIITLQSRAGIWFEKSRSF